MLGAQTNVTPLVRMQLGNPPQALPTPEEPSPSEASLEGTIAGYIRACFEEARNHRNTHGVDERMLQSLRAMRGQYPDAILNDIKQFGGSQVYARITATKVRGVAALLREIYTASDRPWMLDSSPSPEVPGDSIDTTVMQVLEAEIAELQAMGGTATEEQLYARKTALRQQLTEAQRKSAQDEAKSRENVLDDILVEGGFYNALWEFLLDLATFPFAIIKGPVVRMRQRLVWKDGKPSTERKPMMEWQRRSPFDVYFAPWATNVNEGYVIDYMRTSRRDLQALIGLPSYNDAAIREVLDADASTIKTWCDYVESQRADLELRSSDTDTGSSPAVDRLLPMLEFNGAVSAQLAIDWGMTKDLAPNPDEDIEVTAYLVGNKVVGMRKNPHPQGKKGFYIDSFERVPGSIVGNSVPDLIEDVQQVGNATLRALVNNLAIASGPMGYINEDRLATNDANADKLWPWKMFRMTDSEMGNDSRPPVEFFQPNANAQELLTVYERMLQMADEFSSLPRYMQGSMNVGGAGRTASGLSMLMDAANRTIKQTVASVDANIIEPVVSDLNVYVALTRPDLTTTGDINVVARGAIELVQRETLRMRRLEFLNITNNPMDGQLLGPQGRGNILKEVAKDLGLPSDQVMVGLQQGGMQPGGMQPPPQPGAPNQPNPQAQAPAPTDGAARTDMA